MVAATTRVRSWDEVAALREAYDLSLRRNLDAYKIRYRR